MLSRAVVPALDQSADDIHPACPPVPDQCLPCCHALAAVTLERADKYATTHVMAHAVRAGRRRRRRS